MQARHSVETVSPFSVYRWTLAGVVLALAGYLLPLVDVNPWLGVALLAAGTTMATLAWRAVSNPWLALRYAHDPGKTVASLIGEWTPEPAQLEAEFERSLHDYLRSRLPFLKITRQYGSARVKCDIAVGAEVIIELKVGFRSTQKLQRLIGQVDLFRSEWGKPIIVVLLGETQDDLLHDLYRSLERYRYGPARLLKRGEIRVMVKEAIEIRESRRKMIEEPVAAQH
jgi:hypothetical protein